MPGTFIQANNVGVPGPASSASVSFSPAVGVAHLVDVWVAWSNSTSGAANNISSITDDKSNVYHLEDAIFDNATQTGVQSSFLEGINNGPITITVNFTDGNNFNIAVYINEWSGLVTSSALDGHTMQFQVNPGTGTDAVTSGNITTAANGDLISAMNDAGISHGTGFTDAGFNAGVIEYKTQVSAGVIAGTWTDTVFGGVGTFASGIMGLKAAANPWTPDIDWIRPPRRRYFHPPQQEDVSGLAFTTVPDILFWRTEDERSVAPKRRPYFHPAQQDNIDGLPRTMFQAGQWSFDEPPQPLLHRARYFHQTQQENIEGFPRPVPPVLVKWGFDEPASQPLLRRTKYYHQTQQEDISGYTFTALPAANAILISAGWQAGASIRQKYFHPNLADIIDGYPFTAVPPPPSLPWPDIDQRGQMFSHPMWRRYFHMSWQDDISGLPFTSIPVPTASAWGDIEEWLPPPSRPLWRLNPQVESYVVIPPPTVFVPWGFYEERSDRPPRPRFQRLIQQEDTSGYPIIVRAITPGPWGDIEQWLDTQRRRYFHPAQVDDVAGFPLIAAAVQTIWYEPDRSRLWWPRYFHQAQQEDVSGYPFVPVAVATVWGDIEEWLPVPRRLRAPHGALTATQLYAEYLLFRPPLAPTGVWTPDYIWLIDQLASQFGLGNLTLRQFYTQRYALQWAWSGMASWNSMGLPLFAAHPPKQTIFAADGTVPLLPAPYNKIPGYPVVDAGTLVASAKALLSIGVRPNAFPAPFPPLWAFHFFGTRG